jgi:Ni,Fe-hydrogenase III large subunit
VNLNGFEGGSTMPVPVEAQPTMPVPVEARPADLLNDAQVAIAEFTEAVALIQAAVAEIDTKKGDAIADIDAKKGDAIADMETKQATAIVAVETGKQQAIAAIQALQAALPNITQLIRNAFDSLFGKDKGLSS